MIFFSRLAGDGGPKLCRRPLAGRADPRLMIVCPDRDQIIKMRMDQFLKVSRLVPRRALAQELCENGRIAVDGVAAKSARAVKVGDKITIRSQRSVRTVLVKEVPQQKQLSAARASEIYELLASEPVDPLDLLA